MPYSTDALDGKTILVAEDEYMLADLIDSAIRSAGGTVLGPFPAVAEALAALERGDTRPDGAALNIRLLDGDSYPVADALTALGVPFVFASANSTSSLPRRFTRIPLVAKPYAAYQVVQALAVLLETGAVSPG